MLNRVSLIARIARLEKRASDPRNSRLPALIRAFYEDDGVAYDAWLAEQPKPLPGQVVIELTLGGKSDPVEFESIDDPDLVRRHIAHAEVELAAAQAELDALPATETASP
jgi:hypothetical protein